MFEKIDIALNDRARSSFKQTPLRAAFVCNQSKKISERILKKPLSLEVVFRFKDKVLLIKAPHPQAYELELHRDQIEKALKNRLGEKAIDKVKIGTI